MASHNDPLAVVLDVFVELFSYGAGGRWTGLVTVAGDALASSVSLVQYLEFIRSYVHSAFFIKAISAGFCYHRSIILTYIL